MMKKSIHLIFIVFVFCLTSNAFNIESGHSGTDEENALSSSRALGIGTLQQRAAFSVNFQEQLNELNEVFGISDRISDPSLFFVVPSFPYVPSLTSRANLKDGNSALVGDFSISASPSSRTIAQGQQTTYTITINSLSGFNSGVSLTALNLPGTVLAGTGFSPGTVTPPANSSTTSTFTFVSNASTPTGTFTVTMRGTSGSLVHDTTVSLIVKPPGDFTISASPSSRTISQGQQTTFTITIGSTSGFNGAVSLTALNLPGTVLAGTGFSPSTVTPPTNSSTTSTFTFVSNSSTPTGTFTVTMRGTNGPTIHDTTVSLTITSPGDFTISASPSSRTIAQGQQTTYSITIGSNNGFNSPVSLTALNLPGTVLAGTGFSPSTVTPPANSSTSSTFTFVSNSSTPTGTFTITMRGTSGSTVHDTTVSLTVTQPGDFTISASPSSRTIAQGQQTTYSITIGSTGGFNGPVSLTALNLPGTVLSGTGFSPATVTPPANSSTSSTFTFVSNASTPTGTFTVTMRGTSGSTIHDTSVSLTITSAGDFTISASPSSRTIAQGQQTTYSITINSTNGFNGPVSLTALNLPGTVLAGTGFNPQTITPPANSSTSSIFAFVSNASTPTGTFTVTMRGTSGSIIHDTTVSLTVTSAGDFTISALPTTRTIPRGQQTTYAITITSTGGFSSPVNLTALNLPGTVLAGTAFSPSTVTPTANGSASSTFTFVSNASTPAGTFTVTMRGTSGSVIHETPVSLTITSAGDFSASVTPPTRTISRGQTASYTVTFNSISGFSGPITPIALNWSNVPGSNAYWTPTTVNVPAGGNATAVFTIQTASTTTPSTYGNIILSGTSGTVNRVAGTVSLTVNSSNAAPVITPPISPSSVTYNQVTTLTVNGSNFRDNFNAFVDGYQITRPGLTFVSSSQVRVQVLMLGSPPYNSTLKIVNDDGQFATATFSVTGTAASAPTISNVQPNPVTVNQIITLTVTGNNFVNKPTVQVIVPNSNPFDIAPSAVTFDSASQIRVQVQMGGSPPYQATLKAINPDQQSTVRTFSVVGNAPTISIYGIEVTQGIQNLANNAELIKGKRTFVRAHVESLAGNINNVSGILIGRGMNGTPLPESPLHPVNNISGITTGAINVIPNPARNHRIDSFLFEMPTSWHTNGTIEIEFVVTSHPFVCNDINNDCKAQPTFLDSPAAEIRFIGIEYRHNGVVYVPSSADIERTAQSIENLFPIPRLIRETRPNISSDVLGVVGPQPYNGEQANTMVRKMAEVELLDGCANPPYGSCKWFYQGLLSVSPAGEGVSSAPAPPNPVSVSVAYLDPTASAHELAHNTGRPHVTLCGAAGPPDAGFVPLDGTLSVDKSRNGYYGLNLFGLSGVEFSYRPDTFDLMSYCHPQWISAYSYRKIRASLVTRYQSARNIKSQLENGTIHPLVVDNEPALMISGTVDSIQGTGSINTIYSLDSPTTVLLPPLGSYSIRFENSLGQSLATYDFAPTMESQGNNGSFAFLLPANSAATTIRLLHNGQPVSSRSASANPPTVTITSPNGGETLFGDYAVLTWNAGDSDGDELKFVVQVSLDNGVTWKTVATDWPLSSYSLDLNRIAGGNQTLIRVLATDGFYTAQDQSNSVFTIVTHGPIVNIITPNNNSTFIGDQTLILQGNAFDVEDGQLNDSSFSWSSNLDGSLGNGSALVVSAASMTEGTHVLTLSAHDSEGRIGASSVKVQVLRTRPVIPASLSSAPSTANLTASLATGQSTNEIVAIRNNGDGVINWTASANQPWLQLGSTSGSTPSNITVSANPAGFGLGTYSGQITIVTTDAVNSPQTIGVNLTVVSTPVSGGATVNGRVRTAEGRGVRGAIVSITDPDGISRITMTNAFGFFSFDNVNAGSSYTVSVVQRRYAFSPQVVQINDNVTLADFVPQ